jgi:ATP-dependent RNA helicase DDX10/DBP4
MFVSYSENFFATDFPAVNWVVQMDCPEDANTYIHRAGRTAR